MVVNQDHRAGRQLERPAHHLARIDRGVVDRAAVHHLVGDQLVLAVEEQHPELFAGLVGQGDLYIGQQGAPGADHGAPAEGFAADPQRRLAQQPQIQRRRLADAGHGLELLHRGRQHARHAAEADQQRFGQRLDLAAREGAEQEQLEQFVVRQGVQPLQRPLAQAFAMAQVVGLCGVARHLGPDCCALRAPSCQARRGCANLTEDVLLPLREKVAARGRRMRG